MKEINLDTPKKNTEGAVLAALWKNVVKDLSLGPSLPNLITRYVNKTTLMGGRVKDVNRKAKSSITKNVNADEMTWKTFLDLLFTLLNVKRIDITIKLTHNNGSESYHHVPVENITSEVKIEKEEKGDVAKSKK